MPLDYIHYCSSGVKRTNGLVMDLQHLETFLQIKSMLWASPMANIQLQVLFFKCNDRPSQANSTFTCLVIALRVQSRGRVVGLTQGNPGNAQHKLTIRVTDSVTKGITQVDFRLNIQTKNVALGEYWANTSSSPSILKHVLDYKWEYKDLL